MIFRVRYCDENTIDELTNSYLWFSRPLNFKGDTKDANIGVFVTDTDAIKRGLMYVDPNFDFDKWYNSMSFTGICCFTKYLPSLKELRHFPKCTKGNAICIEYNKNSLQDFLVNKSKHSIYPCFNEVVYSPNPTKIEMCDEWSILWEKDENGCLYKTIPSILNEHPREFDKFIRILLTRIDLKFEKQSEERIILGGTNIPPHDDKTRGYKITIPSNCISKVYIYPKVSVEYIEKLYKIDSIKNKIVLL